MSILITSIEKGSPAERVGILPGDRLVSISGNAITDVLDYRFYMIEKKLTVTVLRGEEELTFAVKKGEIGRAHV